MSRVTATTAEDIGGRTDSGDGRAQFVCGVGDELPLPRFRRLEFVEHVVERLRRSSEFGVAAVDMQPIAAPAGRDRARQRRHRVQRGQGDAGAERHRQPGRQQRAGTRDQEDEPQRAVRAFDNARVDRQRELGSVDPTGADQLRPHRPDALLRWRGVADGRPIGQHQARLHAFGLDAPNQCRRGHALACELSGQLGTAVEQRRETPVGLDAEHRVDSDSRDQQGGCEHDEHENGHPPAQRDRSHRRSGVLTRRPAIVRTARTRDRGSCGSPAGRPPPACVSAS